MRSILASLFAPFALCVAFAMLACQSNNPPPKTPGVTPETDTTRTTGGSWDTPDLGPVNPPARPDAGVF